MSSKMNKTVSVNDTKVKTVSKSKSSATFRRSCKDKPTNGNIGQKKGRAQVPSSKRGKVHSSVKAEVLSGCAQNPLPIKEEVYSNKDVLVLEEKLAKRTPAAKPGYVRIHKGDVYDDVEITKTKDESMAEWLESVRVFHRTPEKGDAGNIGDVVNINGTHVLTKSLSCGFKGRVVMWEDDDGSVYAITRHAISKFDSVYEVNTNGTWWIRWWIGEPKRGYGSEFADKSDMSCLGTKLESAVCLLTSLNDNRIMGSAVRDVCVSAKEGWQTCEYLASQELVVPEGGIYISRMGGFVHLSRHGGEKKLSTVSELREELELEPYDFVGEGITSTEAAFAQGFSVFGFTPQREPKFTGEKGHREVQKKVYEVDTATVRDIIPSDDASRFKDQVHFFTGKGGSGKTSKMCKMLGGTPVVVVVPKTRLVSSSRDIKDIVMQRVHQTSGALISFLGKGLNVVDVVTFEETVGRQYRYPVVMDDCQRCGDMVVVKDLLTRAKAGLFLTYGLGQKSGPNTLVEMCKLLPKNTRVHAFDPVGIDLFNSSAFNTGIVDWSVNSVFLRVVTGTSGSNCVGVFLSGLLHGCRTDIKSSNDLNTACHSIFNSMFRRGISVPCLAGLTTLLVES